MPNEVVFHLNPNSHHSRRFEEMEMASPPRFRKRQLTIKWSAAGEPKQRYSFHDDWSRLKFGISAIFSKPAYLQDLETLYNAVQRICQVNKGKWLYRRIKHELKAHISANVQALAGPSTDTVVFLSLVDKCWQEFCDQLPQVQVITCYLDNTYVRNNFKTPLGEVGMRIFRKRLSKPIVAKIVAGIMVLIEKERLGEAVDTSLLSRLLKKFKSLGFDCKSFENVFLEHSAKFYESEQINDMHLSDVSKYLKYVEKKLNDEQTRCLLYLDASTKNRLLAILGKQLLECQIHGIIEKGRTLLLEGIHIEDLQRLYMLCSQAGCLESLRTALRNYIEAAVDSIVQDGDIGNCMHRAAELLSKFLSEKLCTGNKYTGHEELLGAQDRVMFLFRFIQGKDVFEAIYRKDLAKRLVSGKSACIDADKSMISKLKIEYGSQFTSNLEQMLQDIDMSRAVNELSRQALLARKKMHVGVEMNVHVMTNSSWPIASPVDIKLPREVSMYQDFFTEFYKSKYPHRKLMWQNSLGHCVIMAKFKGKNKELVMSASQAIVLMLFNDVDTLSFQEIKNDTGIEGKELRGILQSFACGKTCLLRKDSKGKDIGDDDWFSFNEDLKSQHYRVKVTAIQVKETVEEKTSTMEIALQHCAHQIDAAIIRTMKMRKSLNHSELMNELALQLKFPFTQVDIKKRIESLINRDCLQRDDSNSSIYIYLP